MPFRVYRTFDEHQQTNDDNYFNNGETILLIWIRLGNERNNNNRKIQRKRFR